MSPADGQAAGLLIAADAPSFIVLAICLAAFYGQIQIALSPIARTIARMQASTFTTVSIVGANVVLVFTVILALAIISVGCHHADYTLHAATVYGLSLVAFTTIVLLVVLWKLGLGLPGFASTMAWRGGLPGSIPPGVGPPPPSIPPDVESPPDAVPPDVGE